MNRRSFVVLLTLAAAGSAAAQHEAEIVASAKGALGTLRDSSSLHFNGYYAIGFGAGVKDLTPFQGQHWLQVQRFMTNGSIELSRPTFLMYLPLGDSLVQVGVAYTQRIDVKDSLPNMLGSDKVEWHSHVFCRTVPGEGRALADGPDDCAARGGSAAPRQIAMVHTWVVPNPDGPYAHDNPALPYMATGLTPPHHATSDDRLLGVALGETYGAKLPMSHRIELEAPRRGKNTEALVAARSKLKAAVSEWQAAEKPADAKKVDAAKKKVRAAYEEIAQQYRSLAGTQEIAARYDIELKQATGEVRHHHM